MQLCAVTLELFNVLLNLNCEDVMLELVLKWVFVVIELSQYQRHYSMYARYLLPGSHIMPNQLAIVGSPDVYSQAARKFLQLLPASCIAAENMFLDSIKKSQILPSPQRGEEISGSSPPPPDFTSSPLFSGNVLMRPTPTSNSTTSPRAPLTNLPVIPPTTSTPPPPPSQPVSTNPFDHPLPTHQPLSRSRSGSDASSSSLISMSSASSSLPHASGTTTSSSSHEAFKVKGTANISLASAANSSTFTCASASTFQFEYITPEMAYFGFMTVSREAIRNCVIKCQCWSSVYDKCEVSKEMLQIQEQNRRMTKSLEMEDLTSVQVRVTTEEESSSVGVNNDGEDSRNFRSRATTLASAKVARTASLRAHNKLHSRRAMVTKSQVIEKEEGDTKLVAGVLAYENVRKSAEDVSNLDPPSSGLRRSGTTSSGSRPRRSPNSSPRMSPKFGGKISSLCQFEDKTGLFLKIVMDKLMDMMEHPPVVNVLMTQLISRLAHYPQPLLRSLLLNHQLVLKPGVPNLLSVSVHAET